jgi:hypothetical protein
MSRECQHEYLFIEAAHFYLIHPDTPSTNADGNNGIIPIATSNNFTTQ